jgi:hypothetical protein
MGTASQTPQSKNVTSYLAVAFAAMTFVYFKDFSDHHALRHALGGTGFALLAYGTYRNGFVTEARNLGGRYASLIGGAFLLASAVTATVPAVSALARVVG